MSERYTPCDCFGCRFESSKHAQRILNFDHKISHWEWVPNRKWVERERGAGNTCNTYQN